MKQILLFLLLATMACQKDSADVRDEFIGSYDVDLVYSGLDDGDPYTDTGVGVITVRKGTDANELLFNDLGQEHPAYLDGMTFEMPEFLVDGWIFTGSGFFKADGQVEYTLRGKLDDENTQITNVKGRKRK